VSAAFNIMVIGTDPKLAAEVNSALEALVDVRGVTYPVSERRQAIEAARSRAPELVVLELSTDLAGLAEFARDMEMVSPHSTLVGAFRNDLLMHDVSESAFLIEALHCGLKDFLRRPIPTNELRALISRLKRPSARPEAWGSIICFISNKGGVGKSTLSVNVACGLAKRHPDRVLLIDGSLQMGVCASMLDLEPRTTLTDVVNERDRLDSTLLRRLAVRHECGLDLLAAPANAIEAAAVDDDVMSRILTLARRTYDYVIVDTFPMFDRVIVGILDMSDRCYVVTEAGVPVLRGGVKLVQLLDRIGYPAERLKIVLSRHIKITGGLTPAEAAQRLGRPVDYVIPFDKQVLICANTGEPYILRGGRGWLQGFVRSVKPLIVDLEMMRDEALKLGSSTVALAINGRGYGLKKVGELNDSAEGEAEAR
jgi:pilus assembly protein CpaE